MALLLGLILFCDASWIRLGNETIYAELAKTRKEQYQGLKNREELGDSQGMLFIYTQPSLLSFWMKGVKIPLSIGFFDENKILISTEEMSPPAKQERTPKIYQSKEPALYALEMPARWFERHGIAPGTRFEWVEEPQ